MIYLRRRLNNMNNNLKNYDIKFQENMVNFFKIKRIERKISIDYIARYLDVLPSTYARYENGNRSMPLSVMKELCRFYSINYYETFKNIDELVSGSEISCYILPKNIEIKKAQYSSTDIIKRLNELERVVNEMEKHR